MSYETRDYLRDEESRYGGGGGLRGSFRGGVSANLPGMTLWLLIINVLVFLVDSVLTGSARGDALSPTRLGRFSTEQGVLGFQVWRVVTYQFLHANFLHLLFNMIGLWVFGGMIERWWGSKRFLAFYLLGGVGGALLFALSSAVPAVAQVTPQSTLVGASGCVLGCVAACMVVFPKQPIGLFFIPITFTVFALGAVYIGLDVLQVLAGGGGAGSAVAHLGGAGVGYLLVKNAGWLNFADRMNPQAIQDGWTKGRYEKKVKAERAEAAEVDRILAKVKEKGLHSLSAREKKVLNRDTERKRKAG